jgi:multiple sugar transport system substrate-binding protein
VRSTRAALAAAALLALLIAAAGCGGSGSGAPTLTWYINPDNGGQARLAEKCAPKGGPYKVNIQTLPNDASQQREQLVRRLAAHDSSIDLMSLDPVFVAEFANAGFLHAFDKSDQEQLTKGVLAAPLKTVYWDNKLIAAPFWANTQLLWYRKAAVQAAGVDPSSPNFTWADMINAAVKQNKIIGVQASRYEGYMVWINALVMSAGGQIITNLDKGQNATPTIASPAGDAAATVVGDLARSKAAPPAMSNATEEEARSAFQSDRGMFMVNWPYVYAAAQGDAKTGAIKSSVVSDIGWARYPAVIAGKPSKPPFGGIDLAIGAYSHHTADAVELVKCLTSLKSNVQYMLDSGNPAAKAAAYDDPAVRKAFPMADLIRQSINEAGPRPVTPYYNDVSTSVQMMWHPPENVHAPETPKATQSFMTDVLHGKRLL